MDSRLIFVTIPKVEITVEYKSDCTTLGAIMQAFSYNYYQTCMMGGTYEIRTISNYKITANDYDKRPNDLSLKKIDYLYLYDKIEYDVEYDYVPDEYLLGENINITIKALTGKKYKFNINTHMTILYIKYLLYKEINYPTSQIRLRFNSTELINNTTINENNIKDGDELFILLRLRSGMWYHSSEQAGLMFQKHNKLVVEHNDILLI
jgi:hypothetical protein